MSMQCNMICVPNDKVDDYWNLFENTQFETLDLGQVWHGLSFLLSDAVNNPINANELDHAIMAKHCFNPEVAEDGDFPTLYNDVDLVAKIANELQKLDIRQLLNKVDFDYFTQNGIYSFFSEMSDDEKDDNKAWLLQSFNQLKDFYEKASKKKYAIVVYIG